MYFQVDDQKVLTENYYYDEYYEEDDLPRHQASRSRRQAPATQSSSGGGNSSSDLYEYYEYYVDADQVTQGKVGGTKREADDIIPADSKKKLPKDADVSGCYRVSNITELKFKSGICVLY